ncbi:MAG: GIY-YIG nuclease family protein [Gemmatimonadota bacterium]
MHQRLFTVYILSSLSRTLYVGVTNNLPRRLAEHRAGIGNGFTGRYRITRLVWFEQTPNAGAAIAREKEIKGWDRERRCQLIESQNLGWRDLAVDW